MLTVELAEDLIVDLPLMQRVAAQRLELLGDREVAELIVIPRAHLLLDRAALTWLAQQSALTGVHHRAIVVPAHLLVWRDRLYQMMSRMRPNVRVFRNPRPRRRTQRMTTRAERPLFKSVTTTMTLVQPFVSSVANVPVTAG